MERRMDEEVDVEEDGRAVIATSKAAGGQDLDHSRKECRLNCAGNGRNFVFIVRPWRSL